MRYFRQFSYNVTLLGGGAVNPDILSQCVDLAPELVAADGGADQALELGHVPVAVAGDMDSVSAHARETIGADRFVETPDQNRTDFHKTLDLIDAPVVLGVGFMGKRLDHELACYNTLVRMPEKRVILVGEVDICFHLNGELKMALPVGTRFSLFPMARVNVRATGLVWPVEDLEMSPWGMIGTSNETNAPNVNIKVDGPGLLVILPRAHLTDAIAALTPPKA
ncbi:thiamine diphosphokinase [Aliiroseovarius sp. S1339]|uniref:thiamine diphosphokinase n=1 Tax=Aliiroseovarius sp. S1339 TaxID=2936990 RepID=UPI0020BF77C3|nr:thiamine diphosphokinase [Aliiroseovarius sp. S1339]MCK8464859.1 thiamine diphosphokinase [Aliiroseovarius sp. S1339]